MATVVTADHEDDNRSLISRFRKKVLRENIIEEIRERRFHKKPSIERKERMAAKRRGRRVSL